MTRAPRRRSADAVASSSPHSAGAALPPIQIPEAIKPSVRLHLRLARCRNLLMREARLSVERWGLTLPQFDVLAELSRAKAEGFTFVELSRLLLVTSGNLTGIVDRLEAEGLVRRQTDVRDRRLVRIVLTKKGRRLAQEILPRHAQDIHALLAFLPPDQMSALVEMLGRLREGLRARLIEQEDAREGGRTSPSGARPRASRGARVAAPYATARTRGATLAAHVPAITRHD